MEITIQRNQKYHYDEDSSKRKNKSGPMKSMSKYASLLLLATAFSSILDHHDLPLVQSFTIPISNNAAISLVQQRRRRVFTSIPMSASFVNETTTAASSSLDLSSSNAMPHNDESAVSKDDTRLEISTRPYISPLLYKTPKDKLEEFAKQLEPSSTILKEYPTTTTTYTEEPGRAPRINRRTKIDPLWLQIKLEAQQALQPEPEAGPQLYQYILSQTSLIDALVTIISNEISTELMPATSLRCLFLDMLHPEHDDYSIHFDVLAAIYRCGGNKNSSSQNCAALSAVLFNQGLHALICYRVGHRLWEANRKGLAYYMQSTVSSKYSADIHPAAKLGAGIYLNCGCGVVIGETAVVGDNTSILQGVTLGGTGKEAGDRHPKVGKNVILYDSVSVLGNIQIGDGAIVSAKSIVTKPVPSMACVSGIPAKIQSYRPATVFKREDDEDENFGREFGNVDDEDDASFIESDGDKKTKDLFELEETIWRLSQQQWQNVAR